MSTTRRQFILGTLAASAAAQTLSLKAQPASQTPIRKIAVEEGYMIPELGQAFFQWVKTDAGAKAGFPHMEYHYQDLVPIWTEKGLDLGEGRIKEMDDNGIAMQVISLSAGGVQWLEPQQGTELAALANDRLAEACQKYPDRFRGLAAIAPQIPDKAAQELERAVTQLDLRGAIINSNVSGEYMDEEKYFPIFEAAQALDVPIYLHPSLPAPAMLEPFTRYGMVGPMAGFQAETSTHALRLIMSGLFDQFPRLRMILGHLGEGIPFFLDRIDRAADNTETYRRPVLKKHPSDYFHENFVITTSGMNSPLAVKYCIDMLGIDKVLFAIDYPYEKMMPDATALDDMPLTRAEKEKLFHSNAERVFDIKT